MKARRFAAAAVAALLLAGCGKSYPALDLPVTGAITLDGKPAFGTSIFFIPTDQDLYVKGMIGQAHTGADGKFTLENEKGAKTFYKGEFKVTFTRYILKNGKPIPMGIKPDDVGAVQQLPPEYINPTMTPHTVTVTDDKHDFTFDLKTK